MSLLASPSVVCVCIRSFCSMNIPRVASVIRCGRPADAMHLANHPKKLCEATNLEAAKWSQPAPEH